MFSLTVAEIAERVGGAVEGDTSLEIRGVAGIRYAAEGDISYVSQSRYASDVDTTGASAVIVGQDWSHDTKITLVRVEKPEKAFEVIAVLFAPEPVKYEPGIHPTAVIASDAVIGADVHIGPYCVLGSGVSLGDRTVLVGHNYIADGVSIGIDGLVYPHVSIREFARIGDRVMIHNGTVIGSDGFGYDVDEKGVRTKVPQIGIVEIGDDVEIGANTTIDRARFGKTIIGNGVKIDNLVQIAHNVTIGDHAVLVSQCGIAGSTSIGAHVILAGQAGVGGHLTIAPGVICGARAGVTKSITERDYVTGFPAMPQKQFAANLANVNRLPKLKAQVAALEERIKALENS